MEITNSNYLWAAASALYTAPTTSYTDSTSTFDSTFTDILNGISAIEETDSLASQMASLGAESMGTPPDFSSMTSEEFLEHLLEMQEALEASGADISGLVDPTTLSSEELEALQAEMASRGDGPPPPPPPMDSSSLYSMESLIAMMSLNMVDYSSLGETLFDYI